MAFEDTANSAHSAIDQGRDAADRAADALKDGYDAAQQFVQARVGERKARDLV